MSARFGIVESGYWRSRKMRGASDGAKLLGTYLFSCQHGSSAGIFHLPYAYISADLGWSEKQVRAHVSDLSSRNLIEYDEQHELIRLVGWFDSRAGQIDNRKHLQSILRLLEEVKCQSPIFHNHVKALEESTKASGKEYLDGLDTSHLTRFDTGTQTGSDTGIGTSTDTKETNKETNRINISPGASALEIAEGFSEFWREYPRKDDRADAERAYRVVRGKAPHATIMAGIAYWRARWRREGTEAKFIPYGGKWLRHERWRDAEQPASSTGPPISGDPTRFARAEAKRVLAAQGMREGDDGYGLKLAEFIREIMDDRNAAPPAAA
jgi:hypothetical protein